MKKLLLTSISVALLLNICNAQSWKTISVDSLINTSSLTVTCNNSGTGYIAYLDNNNHDLKMAKYNVTYFDFTTIDEDVWGGAITIKIKADGTPAVLYYDGPTSSNMKYGEFDGTNWTTSNTDILNGQTIAGASLVFDADGNPHIVFGKYGATWEVHYAYFDGTTWTEETIDENGHEGSLAIDNNGDMHVAYFVPGDNKLKYAKKSTGGTWGIQEVTDANSSKSIKIKSNGNPCIGYTYDNKIYMADWDGSAWQTAEVHSIYFGSDGYVSMDMDKNDKTHFTYYQSYTLHHLIWDGTNAEITDFDMIESTGANPNIACGAEGSIHIVYQNKYMFKEGSGSKVEFNNISQDKIKIFPNPFNTLTNISFGTDNYNNTDIKIFNSIGQVVKNDVLQNTSYTWYGTNNKHKVVEEGMYFIVINSNNRKYVKKVIKK